MIFFEPDYVGDVYNLEHPRILWSSVTRRGSVAASTEATGFEAINAATATEFDSWKPTAMPATWTLTFDASEDVNALAIETHTLGTSGATVTVQEWNGSTWDDIVAATPDDDEPIAFLFGLRNTDRLRLSLTGATAPQIAVVHVSQAIECPQRVYMGAATPINMALRTEFSTNTSVKGKFIGRSVEYSKNENAFRLEHVTEYWVQNTLFPFIKDAREYPYFLLEQPHGRPQAISYRMQDSDIVPERMGIKSLMRVEL